MHSYIYIYVLVKALPHVCMENTAQGGVSRDKYSMRREVECCICLETPPTAVFFIHTSLGGALTLARFGHHRGADCDSSSESLFKPSILPTELGTNQSIAVSF